MSQTNGIGIISDIMNILEKVTFGEYYFKIAMVLRESKFINGILTNTEIWYGLTEAETSEIEDLDTLLLRKILNTKFSVPKESLYLELGCLNIKTILKARRVNYLHYLVSNKCPNNFLWPNGDTLAKMTGQSSVRLTWLISEWRTTFNKSRSNQSQLF